MQLIQREGTATLILKKSKVFLLLHKYISYISLYRHRNQNYFLKREYLIPVFSCSLLDWIPMNVGGRLVQVVWTLDWEAEGRDSFAHGGMR